MPRLWLKLASAAVFLAAWTLGSALEHRTEAGIFAIEPRTPYLRYLPEIAPRGRVLVVHGLHVSKETMQIISSALVDGGFEVYSIDLPGHGDSAVGFDGALAHKALAGVMSQIGEDSIVLGHSLGAGLLLDAAADRRFSTMVLLAPPPLPIARIQAGRILIATGEHDIPRIRTFLPVAADIGGPQVESWILPWAAHSAPIFHPVYVRRVVQWLGGEGGSTRTLERLIRVGMMFIAAATFGVALMDGGRLPGMPVAVPATLMRYLAACGIAVAVLHYVNPVSWLRLFVTDYLVGFLFIAGLILTLAGRAARRARHALPHAMESASGPPSRAAGIAKSVAAAVFVIAVLGGLVAANALHTMPLGVRWWRFPCIALAGLPLFIFDEVTLRRILPAWKSAGIAVLTRVLFLAFLLIGILILDRENAALFLIAPLLTLFWIALWFATGVVHRHTRYPFAAALFATIVQGWAFAAWFVTI